MEIKRELYKKQVEPCATSRLWKNKKRLVVLATPLPLTEGSCRAKLESKKNLEEKQTRRNNESYNGVLHDQNKQGVDHALMESDEGANSLSWSRAAKDSASQQTNLKLTDD